MTDHERTWLTIAEAYLTPQGERTEKQVTLSAFGLCHAYGTDAQEARSPKYDHIASVFYVSGISGLWLPTCAFGDFDRLIAGIKQDHHLPVHDELRGLQALFFAVMSPKEFEQLLEPVK